MVTEQYVWGTGRRKTSVASVRIKKGTGKVTVNKRDINEYFPVDRHKGVVLNPFKATKTLGGYDVLVNVRGGGISGQAGAVCMGIARAMTKIDSALADDLRENGLLTRDSRMKERKKYGRKGARKSFQWTKR
ncbi:30S ribosomal subunit protein S9 [Candidatus Kuenenia stuttgartiensis]|jgi:small subunit ribosomal protein S9|uniref:Small ribosomal subunit protein uS9 n=1 Tax=Kuenenia stuttgartiensis TaxID=174633 RepID=Q1Q7L7_KUEST|nr:MULTISPECIES: 30S ribosomal protein S9 [Kuenenia]MBE7548071.1 30S ribosomal protein S9 [Planctomycetia bacterium]MBZ0190371.1 30S ribosomal protein S9 [Candidatus Kuenenia stuttgartiensis]MCF6152854.1 30S ribosomal protein S9 [Candidatus Kuenenia stuttgartiensis]MCL4727071.1 30S ribosomal protein S9 [Candidatus Kuenenia stuttgartiensis]MCZ7622522.1 30S ribosomal protein S9 [Candidatus Kuenenia sp.]